MADSPVSMLIEDSVDVFARLAWLEHTLGQTIEALNDLGERYAVAINQLGARDAQRGAEVTELRAALDVRADQQELLDDGGELVCVRYVDYASDGAIQSIRDYKPPTASATPAAEAA